MAAEKPPVLLYGAIGVLLLAVAVEGMYIAYLRGRVAQGGPQLQPARSGSIPTIPAPAVAATPTPAAVPGGRTLTPEQRSAMISTLGGAEMASTKPVWFAVTMSDPEALAFQRTLQGVFEEANWQTIGVSPISFPAKPGMFVFSSDEEPPEYVQTAVDALEVAGLAPMVGRGYRSFYQEKKKEDPNWRGFELADEQTYVIVVGRNGTAEDNAGEGSDSPEPAASATPPAAEGSEEP